MKHKCSVLLFAMCMSLYSVALSALCTSPNLPGLKLSLPIRNAQLNTIEPVVGPNPILRLCGGPLPSSVSSSDGGTEVARIVLPLDWATTSTTGIIVQKAQAQAKVQSSGPITHFRLYSSDGTPHIQGSISISGGSGVLTIPTLTPTPGQILRVNTFTITDQNEFGTVPPSANRLLYSIAIQNAKMNVLESVIGPSPKFDLLTGSIPSTIASPETGTTLARVPLPPDWVADASGGVISKLGTWTTTATATGVVTHGTFFDSTGTIRHAIVDVTGTAGTGLAKISPSTSVTAGDTVNISTFTLRSGNQ